MKKIQINKERMHIVLLLLVVVALSGWYYLAYQKGGNIITGAVIMERTENVFQYNNTEGITREGALNQLLEAEDIIKEMQGFNLSTYFVNDNLLKAKRTFIGEDIKLLEDDINNREEGIKREYLLSLLNVSRNTPVYEIERLNYSEVYVLVDFIRFKKEQTYKIIDTIAMAEQLQAQYKKDGIDTSEAEVVLEKAKQSLREERYDEADTLLKETAIKLEEASLESKRVKGILMIGKNFFARYWWQALLAAIILAAISPVIVKKARIKLAARKLELLKLEIISINRLMKKSQEECFVDKTITVDTYSMKMERHRKRIAEIKHTIPVLEGIISGHKPKEKKESLQADGLEIKT